MVFLDSGCDAHGGNRDRYLFWINEKTFYVVVVVVVCLPLL